MRLRDAMTRDGGWDNLGDWSEARATFADAGEALATRLWALSGAQAGARVLDVGCGYGAQLGVWRRLGAASVLAVEPDVARADAARVGCARDPAVRVQVGDASAVAAMGPGGFDGVLVLDALYHFADRAAFLAAAHRALTPSGRLGFCTVVAPDAGPVPARALDGVARVFEMPNGVPTEGALRRGLREAGFVDVGVEDWTGAVLGGFAANGGHAVDGSSTWRRRLRVSLTRRGCRLAAAAGVRYVGVWAARGVACAARSGGDATGRGSRVIGAAGGSG